MVGKASVGKGCSVTACSLGGIYAWTQQSQSYLGQVTVEDGANLLCEGNNTSNDPDYGDFVSVRNAPITGVAAEIITNVNAHLE